VAYYLLTFLFFFLLSCLSIITIIIKTFDQQFFAFFALNFMDVVLNFAFGVMTDEDFGGRDEICGIFNFFLCEVGFELLGSFGVAHFTVFQENRIIEFTQSTPPDLSTTCAMKFICHLSLIKAKSRKNFMRNFIKDAKLFNLIASAF
jgi:hypothetical protein